MANNFKIFVSRFPTKTAYRRGSVVDVYQLSKIVYEEARILESQTLVGELYGTESEGQSSCRGVVGCDEAFVAQRPDCEGGGGGQGPAGPAGPVGPQGVQGPPGDGGARIFCGYLEGPPKPAAGEISLDCLKNATGYVVRKQSSTTCSGSPATNPLANGAINDFKHSFFYGSAGTTGSGGNSELTIDVKTGLTVGSDIAAGPDSCSPLQGDGYQHRTIFNGYASGGITYRSQQWTFGKYLQAIGKGSETNRSTLAGICRNGATAANTSGLMFIPTQPIYGGGGSTRLSDWADVVGGDGGNGLYDTLAEDNPDCGPEGEPTAPPIANQGSNICAGGTPPSGSPLAGDDNECQGGCSNPIANCSEVTDGDIFIDATNGVMYFYSGGAWSSTGVPLGGESDCTKKGSGSDKCKELGGGGGAGGGGTCQCEQCGECPPPTCDGCCEDQPGDCTNCPVCPPGKVCVPAGGCDTQPLPLTLLNSTSFASPNRIEENLNIFSSLITTLNDNNFPYYIFGTMSVDGYLRKSGLNGYQAVTDFDLVIDRSQIETLNNLIKDSFIMDILQVNIQTSEYYGDTRLGLISKTNNLQSLSFEPIIIDVLLSDTLLPNAPTGLPKPSELVLETLTINPFNLKEISFKAAPLSFTIRGKLRRNKDKDILDLRTLYFAGLITNPIINTFSSSELVIYNNLVASWETNVKYTERAYFTVEQIVNAANTVINIGDLGENLT
jgi:hypothetical protein